MPIRDAQTLETANIIFGDKASGNPYSGSLSDGALENFVMDHGKLVRVPFMPTFHTSASSEKVWRTYPFQFTRDGAPEQQLLIFKANGRVYKRTGGMEVEISPSANTITAYAGTAGTASGTLWTNPTNATGAINGTYATYSVAAAPSLSNALTLTNYGLSASSTIRGIQVAVTGKQSIIGGSQFVQAQLTKGGLGVGSLRTTYAFFTTDTTVTLGGENDTWGASWNAGDVNDSGFGVKITIFNSSGTSRTVSIDSAPITVYTGTTSPSVLLINKPSIDQVSNKLHISDGNSYLIYDGYTFKTAGLAAPTGTVPPSVGSATGLTGNYKAAVTAVEIRSNNGVDERVHESSRTAVTAATTLTNQKLAVDVSAVTFPTRATHWSLYISELNGSEVLRRVATTAVTTTAYSAASEPAGNAALAPIRNDPVRPSRILTAWKNRIASRSEARPNEFGFTAFTEVDSQLNGDGEECLPGSSSSSISDLVNTWTIPDGGSPMQNAVWHEGFLFVFTKIGGYYITGEGALLDNRSVRDFFPQKQFGFGAAGPFATCSTPKGLVVLSPEHKLWLWGGGDQIVDLGKDIQGRLDDLSEEELTELEMLYWSGEGWSWLMLTLPDRIAIVDCEAGTPTAPLGMWVSLGSQWAFQQPTSLCIYNPGRAFLLSGHADGTVKLLQTLCQPSHVGLCAVTGQTYLSASVQNSPACLIRTGPISSPASQWTDAKYVTYYQAGHTDNDVSGIRTTNPTVTAYYDAVDPMVPTSGVALTSNTVNDSNERKAWHMISGGSSGGHLASSYQVELSYASGADTDSASRPQLVNNQILKLAATQQPKGALTQ